MTHDEWRGYLPPREDFTASPKHCTLSQIEAENFAAQLMFRCKGNEPAAIKQFIRRVAVEALIACEALADIRADFPPADSLEALFIESEVDRYLSQVRSRPEAMRMFERQSDLTKALIQAIWRRWPEQSGGGAEFLGGATRVRVSRPTVDPAAAAAALDALE